MALPKLSDPEQVPSDRMPPEITFSNVYTRQSYPGWERLMVGCQQGEVDWILTLLADHPGPFRGLFIHLVPREGQEKGRYATEEEIDRFELTRFLREFEEPIEQDGRHHLWVTTADNERLIVFDQHNYLYLYGPLDDWITQLRAKGFTEGPIELPVPHGHHDHPQFDEAFVRLLSHWDWHHSPLQEGDEA